MIKIFMFQNYPDFNSDINIDKRTVNKCKNVKLCKIILINILVPILSYEYVNIVIFFLNAFD